MHTFLSFEFLAILNLLIILLWPASSFYGGTSAQPVSRGSALGIIMLILTIIAVVLDIVFLVLTLA